MVTPYGPPLAATPLYTRHPDRDAASSSADGVSRHAVLILSPDSLSGALLGAAVELAGLAPHFPRQEEAARAALLRSRPKVVLIDCDHEEACAESFVGPALMTGARVMLFRSRRTSRALGDFSKRLGLQVIDMPSEHGTITRLLLEATAD